MNSRKRLCGQMRCVGTRHGMTLIEVVLGLAIMGTLLATAVVARGQALKQWRFANDRLVAVEAADTLLKQWWLDKDGESENGIGGGIPIDASGTVNRKNDSGPVMRWRTMRHDLPELEAFDLISVRVEIYREQSDDKVLASVDVVVPDPESSDAIEGGGDAPF